MTISPKKKNLCKQINFYRKIRNLGNEKQLRLSDMKTQYVFRPNKQTNKHKMIYLALRPTKPKYKHVFYRRGK